MEEGVNHRFQPPALPGIPTDVANPMHLPPLALAYVGDTVYEVFVRTRLVAGGQTRPGQLHKRSIGYVRAKAQADVVRALWDSLSDREQALVKRGRNATPGHYPKGADPADYNLATGFEALIGYLYLDSQAERLHEVLELAARLVENPPAPGRENQPTSEKEGE